MENDVIKIIENGGIIGLLIIGLITVFKIAKILYEGQINDLRESKLNRKHLEHIADKVEEAINEIRCGKEAIVNELQKQNVISESNSTHQLSVIKMLEQLANNKLEKIENNLIEVRNSTKDTQNILQNIRSAQIKKQENNIKLREY